MLQGNCLSSRIVKFFLLSLLILRKLLDIIEHIQENIEGLF